MSSSMRHGDGDQQAAEPLDPEAQERKLKVERIFQQFDRNGDGSLNREEMAALVVAVNPRVKFSEEQISAILDEVFRTYGQYIDGDKGLSFDGLVRTYDDGAGDVDRDFDALRLDLGAEERRRGEERRAREKVAEEGSEAAADDDDEDREREKLQTSPASATRIVSITDENNFVRHKEQLGAWASSPKNGIAYDETWRLIVDLESYLRRVDKKVEGKKKEREEKKTAAGVVEAGDWSEELGTASPRDDQGELIGRKKEDIGSTYGQFKATLADYRTRADAFVAQGKPRAFDAHWAMGRTLSDHRWYDEALTSFQRAIELNPDDARAHFRAGNALYSSGDVKGARAAYERALQAADKSGTYAGLLPQVHVNLGIALEGEGMLFGACDHYREAAIKNPRHHRALKLLGSALLGVGEYRSAEKALVESIRLEDHYADAHCDLGSALAALGDKEKATTEFQRAIDLQPKHVDALYNLGGLYRDRGKYSDAAKMYTEVLEIKPLDWRAQLNRAVSLLGAGDGEAARKAFKEAFKTTNRMEVHDAIQHLKYVQKKPKGLNTVIQTAQDGMIRDSNGGAMPNTEEIVTVDLDKFHRANSKTSPRLWLRCALDVRRFQKHTRLYKFNSSSLKAEMDESAKQSGSVGTSSNMIRKPDLEKILRRLLQFLPPEAFHASMKAINERVLAVLEDRNAPGGRVDLGMFLASIAPLCASLNLERRRRLVFDLLTWRNRVGEGMIAKSDARSYFKHFQAMYLPKEGMSEMRMAYGDDEPGNISFKEFTEMCNDTEWGFGFLTLLSKLEAGDSIRHQGMPCAVCSYPIIGPRFKEVTANFNLCCVCYSEGKVPVSCKQDEYKFKEYGTDTADSMRERFKFFNLKGSPASQKA